MPIENKIKKVAAEISTANGAFWDESNAQFGWVTNLERMR